MLPPEMLQNPFFTTGLKARKAHLDLKLKSFRQINRFYEEMADSLGSSSFSYKKKEDKTDFKYQAPGIFR
jgi:hypothetical protein